MMRAPANLYRPNAGCQTTNSTPDSIINNATTVALNQVNSIEKPLVCGGQRMALKLASKSAAQQARELQGELPISPVPQQQQHPHSQPQQHWQANNQTVFCGSPENHLQHHLCSGIDCSLPEHDQLSNCSCSNSLDCLSQNCSPPPQNQPLSSSSHVHLELAHIPNSLQQQQQQQPLIQHQRPQRQQQQQQHHRHLDPHHHQNEDCSFNINPQQQQHHHHQQQHLQSFQQHNHPQHHQQQHHHHQQRHHHHQQTPRTQAPPPPPPPPPPAPLSNQLTNYSQPIHPHQQHRPIMHHSSVPTYVGSNAPSAAVAAAVAQQQQHPILPQQQTLVTQATYTATPETITDNSIQHQKLVSPPMLDRNNLPPPDFNDQHIKQPLDEYHSISLSESKSGSKHQKQQQQQQHNSLNKRQTVSFRRSQTADQTEDMKQQQQLQNYKQHKQPNIYNKHDKAINLDRRDASGKLYRQRSAGLTMQQQQLKSDSNNNNLLNRPLQVTNSNRNSSNDNDIMIPNEQQIQQQQIQQLHSANQYQPTSAMHIQCPGSPILTTTQSAGNSTHHLDHSSIVAPTTTINQAGPGSVNTGHIHQNQHQQQGTPVATYPQPSPLTPAPIRAAHLLTSNNAFDGISLPAITSHRTNSPWMRISSIILTPIGIVIILFIVVSPLLHYLM